MAIHPTEAIIADLKAGKMVIIMDDEDRENEGDLMMLAEHITPEAINFMARYGRGLVCLTITQARNDQLKLWPQATNNASAFTTNFTVSIEAAEGVTTGISAHDRARTIQAAVSPTAHPNDLVQPGHIFPIVAREGGVLTRAGHTEAGCDFARLAECEPAAVIVEILKDDGTMARRGDLELFANEHGLKIGTIADLIEYRLAREQTVAAIGQCELPTAHGIFTLVTYQSTIDQSLHYALIKGSINPEVPTFVRVHVQNMFSDLFQAELSERTFSIDDALQYLAKEDSGIIVVLDEGQSKHDILKRMHAFAHHEAPPKRAAEQDLRTYGIGAQILADQGVGKMRLLSTPYKFTGISGYHLEVSEYLTPH
ncbi:3,4-dihydroxy-2-butanone-4-phosphate synthase [Suttonella sp. R2A3]|uniref:bifunctional 3,4-dihydroxy-2-butanone-4-phosphate synthase/GTP cyclohydrolase II n=1 Tax=Suttonella sp. R2A3 TaxID=2908648 RepID=UPI001EEDB7E2|nr:bifunctional 3,4-dihydroxy-2-butanone-4-phosphate synthase/GTP cyclohydrolase II [Suttonella sp. R2A3]UJF25380.1 3,4-dihydroxy-2-butanone-4-phosphate synthase [Suttonella sp. R2A3]